MFFDLKASPYLFTPRDGRLWPYSENATQDTLFNAQASEIEFKRLVSERNYPCVAARIAMKQNEYRIGVYSKLGEQSLIEELGRDLLVFQEEQQRSRSPFLSFLAVFNDARFESEEAFEEGMWKHLSLLAGHPHFNAPWDPLFSDDPEDKNFCFSLGGKAYFIVGMHPLSSRRGRRFPVPAMIFNLYEQFELLDEETEFYPMVRKNRERDRAYQGSVNPMVAQHAEKWEAIQFSGRNNSPDWKCPFKHL